MVNTRLAIATFALLALSINTQNTCASNAVMTAFGFTPLSAVQVISDGTCVKYFNSTGACVSAAQVKDAMNTANRWLQNKAIDASNFALQFPNASIYFAKNQSLINDTTTAPVQDLSFWDKVGNFFKKAWNYTKALFQTFSAWVVNLFSSATNSINPCFQAWANITNGAYCVAASNNARAGGIAASGVANTFSVAADFQTAGAALVACLPLIDNYCALNYGISITNNTNPFNQTFNWTDGGMSINQCQTIRANTAAFCAPNSGNACNVTLWGTLAQVFSSNWIPFVPTDASNNNLGTFLTGTPKGWDTFKNTPVAVPTTQGFSLVQDSSSTAENLYTNGLLSGQQGQFYKSAFTFITSFVLAVFALLV